MLEAIHRLISDCHKSTEFCLIRSTDHKTPHYVTLYFCVTFSVFVPNWFHKYYEIHKFFLWTKFRALGVKVIGTSFARFKEYKKAQ
jgi:hypothetical protein